MENLKIFSLNLWPAWEKELIKINEKCFDLKPDIIVLQEVKQNAENLKSNIMNRLNKNLKYKFSYFLPVHNMAIDYGKGKLTDDSVWEWLAVLAKKEFKTSEIKLPIRKGLDRWPRSALVCDFGNFKIINLHLTPKPSNIETAKVRAFQFNLLPKDSILVGDFNMLPEELEKVKEDMISSYYFQKYLSFENEQFKSTLDYCLLPKQGFEFERLEIIKGISDHYGLYLEVKM